MHERVPRTDLPVHPDVPEPTEMDTEGDGSASAKKRQERPDSLSDYVAPPLESTSDSIEEWMVNDALNGRR